jgi:hypothetical protein
MAKSKNEPKYSYMDVQLVNKMLGLIKNVGLEVGTLTKLFKLKKAIRESLDELRSLQVEVLNKSY